MRWLFVLLVVLNIGYVTWELNRERPQQVRGTALPKGVEPIVLLSERPGESEQAEAPLAVSPIDEGPETVAGTADSDPEPLSPMDTAPSSAKTALSQPVSDSVDPGQPQDRAEAAAKQLAEPVSATRSEPVDDLCYTLGPFKEMKTLRLVTREIRDYVVEASFRSKEEQEQSMFRVLIRPVASKSEAKALIKKLNSKNIRDHFILTEGPNRNGISLGYFSSKGRAHRHADRVRKLGFDAYAEPVFRSYTIYWLDYRIAPGIQIPQKIFDSHLEKSAQKLSRACS